MKLIDLIESQFKNVDVYEPSGNSSPTTVDSDKFSKRDRSTHIRKKWRVIRDMRKPSKIGITVAGDNAPVAGNAQGNSIYKY